MSHTCYSRHPLRCHFFRQITFDVTVSATSCPKNRENWKKAFYIYPVGLSEKLKVNVELICECGCEANGSKVSPTVLHFVVGVFNVLAYKLAQRIVLL